MAYVAGARGSGSMTRTPGSAGRDSRVGLPAAAGEMNSYEDSGKVYLHSDRECEASHNQRKCGEVGAGGPSDWASITLPVPLVRIVEPAINTPASAAAWSRAFQGREASRAGRSA
ncbi:hypothetical protein EVAR_47417_1 [Eumeta japonica]|uniref:Uncharacterized protein n=1 Tax=Eumeta variegata TaxID=151549 RepID=A0A4C1Y2U8_EUMVA|nr:hypothetical protein EVAR_47417_1 [Eumeta japonica]